MRNRYTFAGHSDYYRRFCSDGAEYIGDNAVGRAIFAWRDGLWLVDQRAGRSTYYVATRVSISAVVHKVDTRAAREALAALLEQMENAVGGAS